MVLGFIGVFIGIAIGIAVGIWAGTRLLASRFGKPDVSRFDIRSDYNDKIPIPAVSSDEPVPAKYRQFIQYFPNWATTPDFYRTTWINHMVQSLWPSYNQAIGKMVLDMAKPYIEDITKQYPFVEALDIELIDFGTKPLRIGGLKVYNSQDDEVIMESPLLWGSNACIRASARLKIANYVIYLPVEVGDFQLKVLSRITLRPLVDTLPCMGAVTISLLETPYIDFALHLFKRFDLMLLPGVSQLANYLIQMVLGDMVHYPNKMTFDIMENGGVRPPPIGLLQVKVIKVESITAGGDLLSKVDPYVDLGVRERKQRTKTVWNTKNPTYDEVFNLIVDDLNTQVLTIQLHDDDMGFNDPVIGIIEQDLADAEFIKTPNRKMQQTLDFISSPAHDKMKRLVKKKAEEHHKKTGDTKPDDLEATGEDKQGRTQYKIPDAPKEAIAQSQGSEKAKKAVTAKLHCEITYVPFKDAGDAEQSGDKDGSTTKEEAEQKLGGSFAKIKDSDKGILTVTLTGCKNLECSDGGVDPYVIFEVEDPERIQPEVQRSSQMFNEPAPHWNSKFDFALISATSTLRARVYDKKSTLQNVASNPIKMLSGKVTGKPVDADEMIGSLKIKVADVVRNERLRDVFALQETQKGDMMITLDWTPISITDMRGLQQTGDQREVQKYKKEQEEEKRREAAGEGPQHEKKHKHHLHLPFTHEYEDQVVEPSGESKKQSTLQKLNPFHHSKDRKSTDGEVIATTTRSPRTTAETDRSPRATAERSGKSGLHLPGFLKPGGGMSYEEQ